MRDFCGSVGVYKQLFIKQCICLKYTQKQKKLAQFFLGKLQWFLFNLFFSKQRFLHNKLSKLTKKNPIVIFVIDDFFISRLKEIQFWDCFVTNKDNRKNMCDFFLLKSQKYVRRNFFYFSNNLVKIIIAFKQLIIKYQKVLQIFNSNLYQFLLKEILIFLGDATLVKQQQFQRYKVTKSFGNRWYKKQSNFEDKNLFFGECFQGYFLCSIWHWFDDREIRIQMLKNVDRDLQSSLSIQVSRMQIVNIYLGQQTS
eukprot:TRINITY_DN22935_c0_g2_i11.p2 TRINITY_DN22935_c0_g2~~TRINITY_DN22935_c0_g2_i11.p2  ORF type:complete len:254 (-),score=5.56 TRINITY_DN22935_c0_g2_i11:172-933(-)